MDKKSLYLCLILFAGSMLVGYISYIFVGVFNHEEVNDENKVSNDEDLIGDENNIDNSNEEEKPATDVVEKLVHYNGDYVDLTSYIVSFDDDEKMKDKLLTLNVDNIKLDGKEYIFSFKNHPQHCAMGYDYMREGYNEFYINDKLIYIQKDQSCYLERVKFLTIIDNKYLGIIYEGQIGNYMKVYDKDIKLIDTLKYKNIEIKKDVVEYSEYVDGMGCYLNYFEYDIVDGNITKVFKKNVKNNECDRLTGVGCDCADANNMGIGIELKNGKEKYIFNKLTLNFNGEKIDDIDGEDRYQYTLDIVLDGKKIDSGMFGNNDKKVIWSSNYASSFRIVDVDNYYILNSYIAKQNDGSYVLIIDKNGKVLKSFEDVGVVINKDTLELEITDCESNNVMTQCPSKVYNLKDFR